MESAKDVGKNVEVNIYQEAIESINFNATKAYSDTCYCLATKGSMMKIEQEIKDKTDVLQPLVDRDEAKPVLHENVMKQFGKCPVCNSSVAIQFHSDFCGKCGNRLKWRGEEK